MKPLSRRGRIGCQRQRQSCRPIRPAQSGSSSRIGLPSVPVFLLHKKRLRTRGLVTKRFQFSGTYRSIQRITVVWARAMPRSAIISMRNRKLNLSRKYHRAKDNDLTIELAAFEKIVLAPHAGWLRCAASLPANIFRFRYLHQSPRGPPHRRTAESVRLRERGRQSGHNHGRRAQLKPSLEKEIPLFSKH